MAAEMAKKGRVMMPWMRKRKRKPEGKLLPEREFKVAQKGLDEEQAEQIAAKKEAEAEAEKIISQAKQEAEEAKKSAEVATRKEAEAEVEKIINQAKQEAEEAKKSAVMATEKETEDILSAVRRRAEIAEIEAKQKALLFLLKAREEIEKEIGEEKIEPPAQLEEEARRKTEGARKAKAARKQAKKEAKPAAEEATGEKIEEPIQSQEETTISEPVVATVAEHLELGLPKKKGGEETGPDLLKQDSHTLYTGEVELAIAKPVDPKVASKLYNYLQTTPEIKLVHTSGSWNRGTTITVVLDKPIPLVSVISSKIPEAEVTPERPEKDGFVAGRKGVRRIKLALKEA